MPQLRHIFIAYRGRLSSLQQSSGAGGVSDGPQSVHICVRANDKVMHVLTAWLRWDYWTTAGLCGSSLDRSSLPAPPQAQ